MKVGIESVLVLNGKLDVTETVSSLIVHGEAPEIPDTLNNFYGLPL
jgi:hypothetical protein